MRTIQIIGCLIAVAGLIIGVMIMRKSLAPYKKRANEAIQMLKEEKKIKETETKPDELQTELKELFPQPEVQQKPKVEVDARTLIKKSDFRIPQEVDSKYTIMSCQYEQNETVVLITVDWWALNNREQPQDYFWENKYLCIASVSPAGQKMETFLIPPLQGEGSTWVAPNEPTKNLYVRYSIGLHRISAATPPKLYWGMYDFQKKIIPNPIPLNPTAKSGTTSLFQTPPVTK